MNSFTVSTIDLSMCDPETGNPITANVYKVDGIARELSISELVMAICLSRATELEGRIVARMEVMGRTTVNIETLTTIQSQLAKLMLDGKETLDKIAINVKTQWYDDAGKLVPGETLTNFTQLESFLKNRAGVELGKDVKKIEDVVASISTKIDSLNTTNQKDLISLQSDTNKRDQSYELITNMLKSIGTTLTGNANNLARR